jgi:hypothetical protein
MASQRLGGTFKRVQLKVRTVTSWLRKDNRWGKTLLFSFILAAYLLAAVSFWTHSPSWKAWSTGDTSRFDKSFANISTGAQERCALTGIECGPNVMVKMFLKLEEKTSDVTAEIEVIGPIAEDYDLPPNEALFLVISSPMFRDPLMQSANSYYEMPNRFQNWVELETRTGSKETWVRTWLGKSRVMPVTARDWFFRPFGSYQALWAMHLVRGAKDGVRIHGMRVGPVGESFPVTYLSVWAPPSYEVELMQNNLEDSITRLKRDGATWIEQGLGLFKITVDKPYGVRAFHLFLLAFVSLPVFLLLWKRSNEYAGLELLGSLASFGAVRAIVVGVEVTIPRQSRGLSFVSRSKRLSGVANATPIHWAT